MNREKMIDAKTFKRMLLFGARNLYDNVKEVNDLNVFPIPDGDTGENMYLTIKGGADEIFSRDDLSVGELSEKFAKGMLLNARGNSGVILSQLFFGLSEGLKGFEEVGLIDFSHALEQGVKRAYSAVAKPVEGTILTVARESVENVRNLIETDTSIEDFLRKMLEEMKKSLQHTPDLLEALKEAGVIDSGGAGLVYIMEGFLKSFSTDSTAEIAVTSAEKESAVDFSKFNEDSVMEFGYCTEFLLQLTKNKTDVTAFSVPDLIDFLSTIGDSIVAFMTGTVVKVHVHTLTPWKALEHCQQFGEFLKVKIENMTLQHSETKEKANSTLSEMNKNVKRARREFAVITVVNGEGLIEVFKEMGADYVINGGQTNNPSAEDFINAFEEVNADHVFVLPNNSNILLTAEQAANMYKDSDVRVIPSKSIGEGYNAFSMLDFSVGDADKIEENMCADVKDVMTGMITHAVRTTTVNGVNITKGDYIGFTNKTMLVSTPDKLQSAYELTEKLVLDKEFIIVSYGKGATAEERKAFYQYLMEKHNDKEIYEIFGEQDVYDFILIVE